MGMYTGIRVKVIVKDEYREMIKAINEGANWGDFDEQFPFLTAYAKQDRAEFIPRGGLCYMPSSWETGEYPNEVATDGFERNIDMETGYWTFQISEAEHIEYLYEEWDESIMCDFLNGEIKIRN